MNHAGRYTNKKNAESYCEYMNKYLVGPSDMYGPDNQD